MTTQDKRGIDYDLEACLIHNPQPFNVDDINRVLAVWEGENDGDDWRWVLHLKDGRFAFLVGGCDYTGWDCISSAYSYFAVDAETAAHHELGDNEEPNEVYHSLLRQLTEGKVETWREGMDREFGL